MVMNAVDNGRISVLGDLILNLAEDAGYNPGELAVCCQYLVEFLEDEGIKLVGFCPSGLFPGSVNDDSKKP